MNDLTKLLSEIKSSTKSPGTDYTGTVTKVENGTAYVQLTGADITDTPVSMTIDAKPGDNVRVRVVNGRAWITGNDTAPPTNDTEKLTAITEDIEKKYSSVIEDSTGKYSTIKQSIDEIVLEVGEKMEADMSNRASSITINSGQMAFRSNSIVVDSTKFQLDSSGNATFAGTLSAAGGTFKGTVTFDWGSGNRQQKIHIGDDTTSPLLVDSNVSGDDSGAWVTAWGFYSQKDSGQTYAELTAEDGLQVTARTRSQQGMGIDCGKVNVGTVAANSYKSISVTFNIGFASEPVVVAGFYAGSTDGGFGYCSCGVEDVTTTGFKVNVYNAGPTGRIPAIRWIAVGQ